jgi:coenzyme F420 hydrogenase subunit delta
MELPEYIRKDILVLGCGNWLFGDDGFGSEAVRYILSNFQLPPNVCVIDAGLSIRNILFDIALSEKKPERIIIIDAIDAGKKPGEVFEIEIDELPTKKIDDFSMHQVPTSNLLKELKEYGGVDVKIIGVQIENVPESVSPGISRALLDSLVLVKDRVLELMEK